MSLPFRTITIVGVGLIGGSIASALEKLPDPPAVRGIDADAATLEAARGAYALDDTALPEDPKVEEWLSAGGSDLVILAIPVFAAQQWFDRLERCGYDGIITDTASTKRVICGIAENTLSNPARFLPGHPMAGSEVNGFSGSRPDMFQGAYWILCPDDSTPDEDFLALHELFSALGARIISIPREQHDSAVAIVSHVPHMVASSLVELAGNHAGERQEILRLAAGGFKDTTRIAAGSPELWCGIAMDNREAVSAGLAEMQDILGSFQKAIADEDTEALTGLLAKSADLRRGMPARWIPDSAKLTQVRIAMNDRPGIIAEVTGIAGHAGCNIESIQIDHINEDTAVLELILTDEGDMGRLAAELINGDYDFSFKKLEE